MAERKWTETIKSVLKVNNIFNKNTMTTVTIRGLSFFTLLYICVYFHDYSNWKMLKFSNDWRSLSKYLFFNSLAHCDKNVQDVWPSMFKRFEILAEVFKLHDFYISEWVTFCG